VNLFGRPESSKQTKKQRHNAEFNNTDQAVVGQSIYRYFYGHADRIAGRIILLQLIKILG